MKGIFMCRNSVFSIVIIVFFVVIASCSSEDSKDGETIASLFPDSEATVVDPGSITQGGGGNIGGGSQIIAEMSDAQIESHCLQLTEEIFPLFTRYQCGISSLYSTEGDSDLCIEASEACLARAEMDNVMDECTERDGLSKACMFQNCWSSIEHLQRRGCKGNVNEIVDCTTNSFSRVSELSTEDFCSGAVGPDVASYQSCELVMEDPEFCQFETEITEIGGEDDMGPSEEVVLEAGEFMDEPVEAGIDENEENDTEGK